jgi:hypothetical protein
MLRSKLGPVVPAVVFSILSTTVSATDFYVDAVNGSDANPGTGPATAWRTLTFAAANAPHGSAHTIHAAPGTYSSASGETFPLEFRGQHVVGDGGPASTIVDAGGALVAIQLVNTPSMPVPASVATLRGFTVQGASFCIDMVWTWSSVTTSFSDLLVRNASIYGIGMTSSSFQGSGASFHVQLSRVRVEACTAGLFLSGDSGSNSLVANDCTFANNTQDGVYLNVRTSVSANFTRCSFVGNGMAGSHPVVILGMSASQGFGYLSSAYSDCLFANNQSGLAPETLLLATNGSTLTHCTVANNGIGLLSGGSGSNPPTYTLDSTLVWGNGTDLSMPNLPTGIHSKVGGADPLFRDPSLADFRVRFGSPVIDAGNPLTPVGALDLARVPRSIDGDLDTNERADIGCHEFRTLDIKTTGQQGTLLELEIFGGAGHTSSMHLGRGAPGAPVATPFGEFDLSAIANFPWVTFAVAPGPGVLFQRPIPTTPIFIGQTYSFQGRVTSSASPSGAAWSNAVSFTIVP